MYRGQELSGRYRLETALGKGGMGEVWSAFDVRLRRKVAVKVLPQPVGAESLAVARFRREAEIAASLQHPGITVVFDIDEDDQILFMVMELLRGDDLGKLLARQPRGLPVQQALSLGVQISEALAAAHESGIVHRDIKPGNLIIISTGRLKICDFGIARFMESTSNLTGNGLIGTPVYMAPEQFIGENVDGRTDLYALGCVLYQMLAGAPPFPAGKGIGVLMNAHLSVSPPSPRAVNTAVPASLDRLIQDLLAKRPADRPCSAGTVAQRLRQIAESPTVGPDSSAHFRSAEQTVSNQPASVRATRPSERPEVDVDASISFGEALAGVTISVELDLKRTCFNCQGTGVEASPQKLVCSRCEGIGLGHRELSQSPAGHCQECQGQGLVEDDTCKVCYGTGLWIAAGRRKVQVRIPAGISDGQRLRIKRAGELNTPEGRPSDLYVRIRVRSHEVFGRAGGNLTIALPISTAEVAQGGEFRVPQYQHPPFTLRIPPGCPDGRTFRARGRGALHVDGTKGDMLVTIAVIDQERRGSDQNSIKGTRPLSAAELRDELLRKASVS